MATDPIQTQAQKIANQALAPVLAEIQRQKQEEAQRAMNARATATAGSAGLAQVLGGIAPQIQDTYKQAGDSTSAYAKGFSAAFQEGSDKTAADMNSFLQQQGSPQQVTSAGQKGADVLYGLGGFIPAAGLAREGAAFTAAAQNLPATALGRGQEEGRAVSATSRDALAKLDALLRQEKGKLPGLTFDVRSQLTDAASKQEALKLNREIAEANYGVKKGQLAVSRANAVTSRMNSRTQAKRLRFNERIADATLDLGDEKLDLAWATERRLSKTPKAGGFTAKQKQDAAAIAFDTAVDDFKGYTDEDGTDVPPRPPVETLRDLIARDVPFSIAIKAIQRFAKGKKPADVDAATWALWRATLKWTKK